jgi:hypothetical protein
MWELNTLEGCAIRSAETEQSFSCESVEEKAVIEFFEMYSIGIPIPISFATHKLGTARCGYVSIPGTGEKLMCVSVVRFGDDCYVVSVSNDNLTWGNLPLYKEVFDKAQKMQFQTIWKSLESYYAAEG